MTPSQAIGLLRQLRGAPLSILCAMTISEADTVSANWLKSATAYSHESIAAGLAALAALGHIEQISRYTWRLTAAARQMPLPLPQLTTTQKAESAHAAPDVQALATPLKAESHSHHPARELPNPTHFQALPAPTPDDSAKSGVVPPTSSLTDVYGNDDELTHLVEILGACHVHHQLRHRLARDLLADTTHNWTREALGWLRHLTADGTTNRTIGATIYPALRDRQPCPDPEALPPLDLPRAAALAWALAGGQPLEPTPDPPLPDLDALQLAPLELLWRNVLASLSLTCPKPAIALLQTTAITTDGAGAFTVLCPSTFARDWLANRMTSEICRALLAAGADVQHVSFTTPKENRQ